MPLNELMLIKSARATHNGPTLEVSGDRCGDRCDTQNGRRGRQPIFVSHDFTMKFRAGDRARTGDVQLGKLAFYQLNYARVAST